MRKLKLQVQMTVDGFVGSPNGELSWANIKWDEELNTYVGNLTEPVDTILLGRKLAQGFIPYWASNPEGEAGRGAEKFNTTPKVVFTKTLETTDWSNTVLAKGDLVEEVNKLKMLPGGDIIVYGGATFVSALVKHGLIDEYNLFINPAAIGTGLSIFKELESQQKLHLKHAHAFPCGIVALCYVPFRA
jgi:dihydrofolate reductase